MIIINKKKDLEKLKNIKGSYLLIIYLEKDSTILTRRKQFDLKKGFYVYVGSAKNGLFSRLNRHFSKNKKLFWHVDFLLAEAKIKKAICFVKKEENELAKFFLKRAKPIFGFGCSDSIADKSHLFFLGEGTLSDSLLRQLAELDD